MMRGNPVADPRPKALRQTGVSQYRMVKTALQGVENERRRFEIHVGDPERQQIITAEAFLQ